MEYIKNIIISALAKKNVFLRFLIVWLLGIFIFNFDEHEGFDMRFKLRSGQPTDPSIVILNITKQDWDLASNPNYSSILNSARPLSDSYFWSTPIWKKTLNTILKDNPNSVTVDLFFDRSIPMPFYVEQSFKLPKVIWRAKVDERLVYRRPRFTINITEKDSSSERSLINIGLGYVYKKSYDNIARRYFRAINITKFLKDLPDKITSVSFPGSTTYLPKTAKPFINYRGRSKTYHTVSLHDLLSNSLPSGFFQDKVVLIGSNAMESHFVKTPLGFLTRTEYLATVIDNLKNNLWIKSFSKYVYGAYLFLITVLCFLILHYFRQGLSVACLILLTISSSALSVILFDIYNIWTPILSPVAIIILSYIILMNHLLSESEYSAWKSRKKEESSREMNELKNNFVSLFSHDLKTPLAKIHGISDRILQNKESSPLKLETEMKKIQKETKELNRYIQSILQVTRIEAGEFNLNVHPHDINELIEECIDIMNPLAAEKNISIEFTQEPLFSIDMDAHLIKEVFLNIIDNSIKYCPNDSKIKIVSSDDSEDNVIVQFSDNGPGVPEAEQRAIFEKFYRSESNSSSKKGTGLGLYLVRYFIEIHDGFVDLKSDTGEGTSFKITLPFEQKNKTLNKDG